MKKVLFRVAAVTAMSILVVSAFAQGGGRGQGGGQGGRGGFGQGMMGGGGDLMLLGRNDVQKELKITAEQKTKLEAAQTKSREDMRARMESMRNGGGGGFDREAFQAEMEKMQAEQKKTIEAILTKEQITRLKELAVQQAGPRALLRQDIQKELGLTADQLKKLEDIQAKQREANANLRDMSPEERQAARAKNDEILKAEFEKVLTAEQNAKYKAMAGAPFKFDPSENRGRGGRGGGGRGGL